MQDTKAAKETQALQAFYDMMAKDSARAFYGPGHVQAAHELGAVQTLLITDTLFRVNNVTQARLDRRKDASAGCFATCARLTIP